MVSAAFRLRVRKFHKALDHSALCGMVNTSGSPAETSPSDTVMKTHEWIMLLRIAIGSSMSHRFAERIGCRLNVSSLLFGLTNPSNMQRSACALTALAGHPTTSSRLRMLGGMLNPTSFRRCLPSA